MKNRRSAVFRLACGLFGIFMAFGTSQALQTTFNANTGYNGLFALYLSQSFGSLIVPAVRSMISIKTSLVLGCIPYILLFSANMPPPMITVLIPLNILVGLGSALIWCSVAQYISFCAMHDAIDRLVRFYAPTQITSQLEEGDSANEDESNASFSSDSTLESPLLENNNINIKKMGVVENLSSKRPQSSFFDSFFNPSRSNQHLLSKNPTKGGVLWPSASISLVCNPKIDGFDSYLLQTERVDLTLNSSISDEHTLNNDDSSKGYFSSLGNATYDLARKGKVKTLAVILHEDSGKVDPKRVWTSVGNLSLKRASDLIHEMASLKDLTLEVSQNEGPAEKKNCPDEFFVSNRPNNVEMKWIQTMIELDSGLSSDVNYTFAQNESTCELKKNSNSSNEQSQRHKVDTMDPTKSIFSSLKDILDDFRHDSASQEFRSRNEILPLKNINKEYALYSSSLLKSIGTQSSQNNMPDINREESRDKTENSVTSIISIYKNNDYDLHNSNSIETQKEQKGIVNNGNQDDLKMTISRAGFALSRLLDVSGRKAQKSLKSSSLKKKTKKKNNSEIIPAEETDSFPVNEKKTLIYDTPYGDIEEEEEEEEGEFNLSEKEDMEDEGEAGDEKKSVQDWNLTSEMSIDVRAPEKRGQSTNVSLSSDPGNIPQAPQLSSLRRDYSNRSVGTITAPPTVHLSHRSHARHGEQRHHRAGVIDDGENNITSQKNVSFKKNTEMGNLQSSEVLTKNLGAFNNLNHLEKTNHNASEISFYSTHYGKASLVGMPIEGWLADANESDLPSFYHKLDEYYNPPTDLFIRKNRISTSDNSENGNEYSVPNSPNISSDSSQKTHDDDRCSLNMNDFRFGSSKSFNPSKELGEVLLSDEYPLQREDAFESRRTKILIPDGKSRDITLDDYVQATNSNYTEFEELFQFVEEEERKQSLLSCFSSSRKKTIQKHSNSNNKEITSTKSTKNSVAPGDLVSNSTNTPLTTLALSHCMPAEQFEFNPEKTDIRGSLLPQDNNHALRVYLALSRNEHAALARTLLSKFNAAFYSVQSLSALIGLFISLAFLKTAEFLNKDNDLTRVAIFGTLTTSAIIGILILMRFVLPVDSLFPSWIEEFQRFSFGRTSMELRRDYRTEKQAKNKVSLSPIGILRLWLHDIRLLGCSPALFAVGCMLSFVLSDFSSTLALSGGGLLVTPGLACYYFFNCISCYTVGQFVFRYANKSIACESHSIHQTNSNIKLTSQEQSTNEQSHHNNHSSVSIESSSLPLSSSTRPNPSNKLVRILTRRSTIMCLCLILCVVVLLSSMVIPLKRHFIWDGNSWERITEAGMKTSTVVWLIHLGALGALMGVLESQTVTSLQVLFFTKPKKKGNFKKRDLSQQKIHKAQSKNRLKNKKGDDIGMGTNLSVVEEGCELSPQEDQLLPFSHSVSNVNTQVGTILSSSLILNQNSFEDFSNQQQQHLRSHNFQTRSMTFAPSTRKISKRTTLSSNASQFRSNYPSLINTAKPKKRLMITSGLQGKPIISSQRLPTDGKSPSAKTVSRILEGQIVAEAAMAHIRFWQAFGFSFQTLTSVIVQNFIISSDDDYYARKIDINREESLFGIGGRKLSSLCLIGWLLLATFSLLLLHMCFVSLDSDVEMDTGRSKKHTCKNLNKAVNIAVENPQTTARRLSNRVSISHKSFSVPPSEITSSTYKNELHLENGDEEASDDQKSNLRKFYDENISEEFEEDHMSTSEDDDDEEEDEDEDYDNDFVFNRDNSSNFNLRSL